MKQYISPKQSNKIRLKMRRKRESLLSKNRLNNTNVDGQINSISSITNLNIDQLEAKLIDNNQDISAKIELKDEIPTGVRSITKFSMI